MKNSTIIFSVCRSILSDIKNHNDIINMFDSKGISYQVIDGYYQGIMEKSIIVNYSECNLSMVKNIANHYDQDSILIVDAGLYGTIVDLKNNDKLTYIGKSKKFNDVPINEEYYSYNPNNKSYFVFK